MRLILDPEFVRQNPRAVELHTRSLGLLLTDEIIRELSYHEDGNVKEALLKGMQQQNIAALPAGDAADRGQRPEFARLTEDETLFFSSAWRFWTASPSPLQDVWLVTGDHHRATVAMRLGLPCVHANDTEQLLREVHHGPAQPVVPSAPPANAVRVYVWGILTGAIPISMAWIAWNYASAHKEQVLGWLTLGWLAPATLAVGTGLFLFRTHLRLGYALLEIFVGMAINTMHGPPEHYDFPTLLPALLQISTGLYIVVRGFDNWDKALEEAGVKSGWWQYWMRRHQKTRRSQPAGRVTPGG